MTNLDESRHVRIQHFFPSLQWLPKYNREDWRGDWPAGLTVGIMLIPQGMAYAMIAELPVVYGLYAALLPQIVYSFLGTSRHLAVGPVAMDSRWLPGEESHSMARNNTSPWPSSSPC